MRDVPRAQLIEDVLEGTIVEETSDSGNDVSPAILFASGFAAGIAVTSLLNPVDRALFLSVSQRRAFLHPSNWRQPFQGLGQSVVSRAVSTGLWFPLERLALNMLQQQRWANSTPILAAAAAGQTAGLANAVLLSPLAFVKYQTWGLSDVKQSFRGTARQIYRTAFDVCRVDSYARPMLPRCEISAIGIFFRGLPATLLRDAAFGTAFGGVRHEARCFVEGHEWLRKHAPLGTLRFAADFTAAGAATALSAPLNYARNRQFGAKLTEATPSTMMAVRSLLREATSQPSWRDGASLFLMRTNLGWGTLRVAGGMAVTSAIFTAFVSMAEHASCSSEPWLQHGS